MVRDIGRIDILDIENRQVRKNGPGIEDLNLAPEGLAVLLNYVFRKSILEISSPI